MADRVCSTCGATNPPTAEFCHACDTYIGWDPASGKPRPDPATTPGSDAAAQDAAPARTPARGTTRGTAGPGTPATGSPGTGSPAESARTTPHAEVPVALLERTDVVVSVQTPGTVGIVLRNRSDIVDGIVVHPAAPPPWLVVTQQDANLMPDETQTVTVTFAVRPGSSPQAQRLLLVLVVRSSIDPAKLVEVSVDLTVPRTGPAPTLVVRPALVRLDDDGPGTVTLVVDNRAANYSRHYRLAAQDAEGVVGATFVPPSLDVPAGGTAEAHLRLTAPVPEPGQEETRQVTVTATSDDGSLDASLTLTRRAAAAPVRRPVVVRLEPSHLRATGGEPVAFDVLLDNRAGEVGAAVELTGRDPQRLVAFSFGEDRLVVPPHHVSTVHALARTAAPPPGSTQQRPFTVVADDGTSPVEASGVLETTSAATAISTARLRVQPATLATRDRHGTLTVQVDNRAGVDALRVRLTGTDDHGQARLTFQPPEVVVPAGQVGVARLLVDSPLPDAGATVTRRLLVTASDATATGATGSVDAEAVLTQTGADHRPAAKRWLVVLGALVAIAGALLPWLGTMVDPDSVVAVATDAVEGDDSAIAPTATAVSTVLVVLLALLMLLGLNGSQGRGIRFAALLIALVAVAAAVAGSPATGLALVGVGALLGFVGGVLARPRPG